mgnify:CR=1 FL=1
MALTAKEQNIFDQLRADELSLVSSFASSLIRNRTDHTDAYYTFQKARQRMLGKNPMSDDNIDKEIHNKDHK